MSVRLDARGRESPVKSFRGSVRPRLFDSEFRGFARAILEMKFDERDQARLDGLTSKNQAGELSSDERR